MSQNRYEGVESVLQFCRIGHKVRHRIIVSTGRLEGIESKQDKKLLADLVEQKVKGESEPFSMDINPKIEKHASLFAKRIIDEQLLDIKPVKNPQPART